MKFGVIGSKGRLGSQLVAMGGTPINIDIANGFVTVPRLDVIINCAAYTRVDDCEQPEGYKIAQRVNATAVLDVYKACRDVGAHLIQLSTDYVFGGKYGPYTERRLPKRGDEPLNSYGLTKLAMEGMLYDLPGVTIVRTTGLYGGVSKRKDFLSHVVLCLRDNTPIKVTETLIGNQTYIPHLADALIFVANRVCEDRYCMPHMLNLASSDVMSRYDFAIEIAKMWKLDSKLVIPATSQEIPGWVAKRPEFGGLVCSLAIGLEIPIHKIRDGLRSAHIDWWRSGDV